MMSLSRLAIVPFMMNCLLIVGCGFHLRGMMDTPAWLSNVAIIVENANRNLEPEIREQLEAYHITIASQVETAHYWLIIEQDIEEQHITSVSSSTTPRQFQMTYGVTFKLQEAKGKEILPSTQVRSTRQITINSDRILGSNDEEAILKREMRRDVIIQIIDRLGHHHI